MVDATYMVLVLAIETYMDIAGLYRKRWMVGICVFGVKYDCLDTFNATLGIYMNNVMGYINIVVGLYLYIYIIGLTFLIS